MAFIVILLLCALFGFALKGLMWALMHPKMALIIVAAGAGILVLLVGVGYVILTLIDKYDENGRGRKKVREMAGRFYKERTKEAREAYEEAARKYTHNWDYAMRIAIAYDTGTDGFPLNRREAQKWYDLVRKAAGRNKEVRKFFEFYEYPSYADYVLESDFHSEKEHRRRIATALLMNVSRSTNMYIAIGWKYGKGVYDVNGLYRLFKDFFGENGVATRIAAVYKRRSDILSQGIGYIKDDVYQKYLDAAVNADEKTNPDKEDRSYAKFLLGMFRLDDPEFFETKLPDKYAALRRKWQFTYNEKDCTMGQLGFYQIYDAANEGSIPALYALFAHEEYLRPPYTDFDDNAVAIEKNLLFTGFMLWRRYKWDEVTQALVNAGFPDRTSPDDWPNEYEYERIMNEAIQPLLKDIPDGIKEPETVQTSQHVEKSTLQKKVEKILEEQFDVEFRDEEGYLNERSSLREDMLVDSLDMAEIVMDLATEFGVEIPEQDVENFRTPGDIVSYLEKKGVKA